MPARKTTDEAKALSKLIGTRIKLYRVMRNLRMADLAKALDISVNQVLLDEKGHGDIRVSKLKQIADYFQIPIYELLPEPNSDEIYQPISNEMIQLISYMMKNNVNVKEAYNIIKDYKREGLL